MKSLSGDFSRGTPPPDRQKTAHTAQAVDDPFAAGHDSRKMQEALATSKTAGSAGFATTQWSLVLSATRDEDSGAALDRLCRRYWKPIYVFLRRSGLAAADAEDATQDFFAYLLDRSWLKEAGPERGRFRGFLLALLRNFMANRRRVETAQKRGGPAIRLGDISQIENLASAASDPSQAYERAWATSVTQSALDQLSEEQERAGNRARYDALRPYLTHAPNSADYDRLVERLEQPRNRIAVFLHRLSRRYGELIRAEVADTVSALDDIDAELRRLIEVLARPD